MSRSVDLRGRVAVAFSRISSGPQEKRDGLVRQQRLHEEAVAHFGLTLIDAKSAIASAFHGRHLAEGFALDLLIRLREDDVVPPGSVLLVETWDRLSREPWIRGTKTLSRIHEAGWIIVTCKDKRVWDADELNGPAGPFIAALLHLAHEDSKRRRQKTASAWRGKWQAALETGAQLTRNLPGWLRLVPKKGFPPNAKPEHCKPVVRKPQAKSAKEAFTLYASGRYCDDVTGELNRRRLPMIGRSVEDKRPPDRAWRASRVSKLLNDRRLLGYATIKLPDGRKVEKKLYPQVISDELWKDVHDIADARKKHTGSRGHAHANLFTKLAYCACGATLTVRAGGRPRPGAVVRGTSHHRHWWNVLQCSASVNRRGCKRATRFLLRDWEPRFLDAVMLSPPPMPMRTSAGSETAALYKAQAALEVEIDGLQTSLDGTLALTARSPSAKAAWEKNAQELDKKRRKRDRLKAEIAAKGAAGATAIDRRCATSSAPPWTTATSPRAGASAPCFRRSWSASRPPTRAASRCGSRTVWPWCSARAAA